MVFTNWNLCVCVRVYAEDALELRATKIIWTKTVGSDDVKWKGRYNIK